VLKDSLSQKRKILMFKTTLQVNTDGTPKSYHPLDLKGNINAINSIGNAVTIKKKGSGINLFFTEYSKAISIFEKYRDNNYKDFGGYSIKWDNVLIGEKINGSKIPCIFKTGEYKGFYSSATSLTNNLSLNKGECECNNQVNPLKIPAFVLPKGINFLKDYGARVGDLLLAYSPITKSIVFGIINDEGPNDKLGEASVLMNMLLLKIDSLPKKKSDTYKLVINEKVFILIIPNSKEKYKIPNENYSKENIEARTKHILREQFALLNEKDILDLFMQYENLLK
jgi:hypothetical protein